MRNVSFIHKVFLAFTHLFVFRQPFVEELDFVDLVIDDKALFLLSWRMRNGYKVKVRKTSASIWASKTAVVLLLEKQPAFIEIAFSNLWRTFRKRIYLKRTQFDAETAGYLLHQIRTVKKSGEVVWHTPLSSTAIRPFYILLQKRTPILRNTLPVLDLQIPYFDLKPVVHSENFIYP